MRAKAKTRDRLEEIIEKLRGRDCRITPQRVAILKILLGSTDHPSIEQVYSQVKTDFPTTSLATVYKTVNLLKDVGEILEIGFTDGGNRYDGNKPYPHPHLICTQCKTILDPDIDLIGQISSELEKSSGYKIKTHQIEFFGLCPTCQEE